MAQPTYQNLMDENQRLREENRRLRMRVDTLETQVRKLTALLEQAPRTGKRQAAPFSKGTPKQHPKPPGRESGEHYGPKAHRPLPEQKPDEIIDVALPEQCPDCGGDAQEVLGSVFATLTQRAVDVLAKQGVVRIVLHDDLFAVIEELHLRGIIASFG